MKIYEVSIPYKIRSKMSKSEVEFITALGILSNQVNILEKLLLVTKLNNHKDEVCSRASNTTTGFLMRMLAGNLNEAWELLNNSFFGKPIQKTYSPKLKSKPKHALKKFKRRMGPSSLIRKARHSLAFHVDRQHIRKALDTDKEAFEIYFADQSGNCLYWGSESLAMWQFIVDAGNGDAAAGMDSFFKEILYSSVEFSEFVDGCIYVFAENAGVTADTLKKGEVDIGDVPRIDSMFVPFFFSPTVSK